ncbi:Transcriptional regulator, AbiEi antitoxin, Type IV TA system [Celeribacter baekdonensis]|uniref:Transcriptional regulator, AbiEi antitoxin, Type IV TA system n=2 Tax=Celeribacter baekdonensis TaxID=875171 RepID=A0A1G7MGE6_9RHOB|nr:Transcriptional regulator, AbiEi antitoxin, Type IV TA system [Celeribacter baekdonensis]
MCVRLLVIGCNHTVTPEFGLINCVFTHHRLHNAADIKPMSVYENPESPTMSTQRGQKLNSLQHLLPEGLVVSSRWLDEAGYSSALRSKYVASGWLEQPARGLYRRPRAETQWQHMVVSLQSLMRMPVAVGGLTALELQGYGHYVPMGHLRRVYLYTEARLPKWLNEMGQTIQFLPRNARKLFSSGAISKTINALPPLASTKNDETIEGPANGLRIHVWGDRSWPMMISRPERAILEFLDELPDNQSFQHVADLFTGLSNLSPRQLQETLESCDSVKVKRLFLWFAERSGHSWGKRLDLDAINTGSGKRVIAKGGRLDPKYHITVPKNLDGH